ncbi:MAG: cytochrome c maturation protein CcmE [Myxococcota bacterium]|nr:cytochrome c maturation protein CcmE [Myxococcota bacterium]
MDGSFPGSDPSGDETSDLLARAKAGDPAPRSVEAARGAQTGRGRMLVLGVVGLLLIGAVAVLLVGGTEESSPFVYSLMVEEVVTRPSDHLGRTLRVEGQLQNGSVLFREDPCEWRFVLEREGQSMPVEFPQCVVPDTFRDGMGIAVVVEGELREDGSFLASQVIPRCPSRYEMEQREQAGEVMPHPPS